MNNLIEQMQMDMSLREYSPETIKSYLWHIKSLCTYFPQGISTLTEEDIRKYLYHLKTDKDYSSSYLSQAYSAVKYLYRNYFEIPVNLNHLRGPRVSLKLPVVLNREQIQSLFEATRNLKHKMLFMVIYSGGLRVGEAVHLKVSDIDSHRMQIKVCQGKGRKDRYTLLSRCVLEGLREYWKQYRPRIWLFPSRSFDEPLNRSSVQKVFHTSCRKAGITEPATVHTLRHSFATHLLDQGVNLFVIQRLLGHKHIQNTLIYLHLQRNHTRQIKSPLDEMLEG